MMRSFLLFPLVVVLMAASSRGADAPEPEARLLDAISLLERQPRTQGNIDRAQATLLEVAGAKGPASPAALYLAARVAEVHSQPSNVGLAIRRYEELFATAPEDPLAQAGVVKMLLLMTYQDGRDPAVVLKDAEVWGGRLTNADALRNFHLLMGRSLLFFHLDRASARDHFEAALKLGLLDPVNRANTLVTVAELYFQEGKGSLAKPYYERFLAEFSRDQRRRIVKERLAAIADRPQ
jgi:tetratricopeptide (TPR) repeat protein